MWSSDFRKREFHNQRRVHPLAQIIGYGGSNNCHHMTSSPSSGEGLARAIRKCLNEAGNPEVDMCISHGTGTINNDLSELNKVSQLRVLLDILWPVPVFTML